MAYGLDFEEIYYTDHNRYDLGVLQTYKISIDLANEKDFSIESPEPIIPVHGFWYIKDTEYGGRIDTFDTDSDEESITYTGRTFRGLLESHFVDMNGVQRTIPSNVSAVINGSGASTELATATITDCANQLIAESGLDGMFVVDEADVDESVSPLLTNYTIKLGTSLYEALMGMAKSIDFNLVLRYRSDGMVHITPILIQDYVDYLKGSRYEGIGFRTSLDTATYNHLIVAAYDDTGNVRVAHFFADQNGGIQPYKTVEKPIKDEEYIIDKSSQLLFGVDERTAFEETSESVVENYEALSAAPADWNTNFAFYYKHVIEDNYTLVNHPAGNPKAQGWYEKDGENFFLTQDTSVSIGKQYYMIYEPVSNPTGNPKEQGWYEMSGTSYVLTQDTSVLTGKQYYVHLVNEDYAEYEAEGDEIYTPVTSQPSDWAKNYSKYYIRTYNELRDNYTVVVNPTGNPKTQGWYEWNGEEYVETNDTSVVAGKIYYTTEWTYTPVSAESVIDYSHITQIRSIPSDWSSNYGEYYYKWWNGTDYEYRNYEGKQQVSFIRMTKAPEDWHDDFGNYYRKVFKKEIDKKGKVLVDYVSYNGEYYTTCKPDDDKKNGQHPSFKKYPHYRAETKDVAPTFNNNNCYRIRRNEVAPTFNTVDHRYFSMRMSYHAPRFVVGQAYRMVLDHYAAMAETAIDFFEDERIKNNQEMELDYFVVNVGDVIGGTDEFTKTNVVGHVSNIEADIESGLIDVKYTVSVDDYTSALIQG